jgi:hypothetical protein
MVNRNYLRKIETLRFTGKNTFGIGAKVISYSGKRKEEAI